MVNVLKICLIDDNIKCSDPGKNKDNQASRLDKYNSGTNNIRVSYSAEKENYDKSWPTQVGIVK